MPSGYSSLGGQVLNPYDAQPDAVRVVPGSGAAAAPGLATLTVGTETSGSIISPGGQAIVGLQPTLGLVQRPASCRSRPPGHRRPDGRTVADAAHELAAMGRVRSTRPPQNLGTGYSPSYAAPAGERIGVPETTTRGTTRPRSRRSRPGAEPVHVPTRPPRAGTCSTTSSSATSTPTSPRLPGTARWTAGDVIAYNDAHPE